MKIKDIKHQICNTELKNAYNLFYSSIKCYHSIKTIININDKYLIGEVTPLFGYTDETIESITKYINEIKKKLIGCSVEKYIDILEDEIKPANSFAISSLLPPVEIYRRNKVIDKELNIQRKHLIYAFDWSGKDKAAIETSIYNIRKDGYNTIKIKVGKNFNEEIKLINHLSKIELADMKIRFDANTGYNLKETISILDILSNKLNRNTEYLEQPLCKNCWNEMEQIIKKDYLVPIMLDESIYNLEDIKKASNIGVKFVKIKLCKFGSLKRLKEALYYAKNLNLNVIFGNGVATDIANYYEHIFFHENKEKIYGASESIGFLKLKKPINFNIHTI